MQESKEQQLFFMRWAIQLAEKGRWTTPPNPWVGCVIVNQGQIIAEGYHEKAGGKHAEIIALEKAGALARGATAYTSLEPCMHYGKTPPCVDALMKAGIKRVMISLQDPDPKVSGKGIEALKKAGIEVVVGVASKEAELSLKSYLYQRKNRRPFCVMKSAMSLDGKTAAADGTSQWITGEEARRDVHRLRAESQAILVGAKTALIDHPKLTVRIGGIKQQPLRVILDRRGSVPPVGSLADCSLAPTLIFTTSPAQGERWQKCRAEVIYQEVLTLQDVLEELGRRQIIQALVEGGSQLQGAFLKEGLVNRIVLYVGNCLLGEHSTPFLPNFFVKTIDQAPRWDLAGLCRFGNDIRLDYDIAESV